jgi:hypothetical protein
VTLEVESVSINFSTVVLEDSTCILARITEVTDAIYRVQNPTMATVQAMLQDQYPNKYKKFIVEAVSVFKFVSSLRFPSSDSAVVHSMDDTSPSSTFP